MSKKIFLNNTDEIPVSNIIMDLRLNNSILDNKGNFTFSKIGTEYSTGIFSGGVNESINFNALSDRLTTPDVSLLNFSNTPFSISFCMNLTNIGVLQNGLRFRYLITKRNGGTNREWQINTSNDFSGKLEFYCHDNSTGGYISIRGGTILMNSASYHVVCTYDGGNSDTGLRMYINGVMETLTSFSSGTFLGIEDLGEKVSIGGVDWSTGNAVSPLGRFSAFRVWNKRLKYAEVKKIAAKQMAGIETF